MKAFLLKFTSFIIATTASILLICLWLSQPITPECVSVPGQDKVPDGARNTKTDIKIGEFFKDFNSPLIATLNQEFHDTWSNFRGLDYKNIVTNSPVLIDQFGQVDQRIKWKVTLGEGHSAPVVYKGVVYVLDYLEEENADALRAFSLKDGKEIWRRWYHVDMKRNHGFSRTIPAVNEDVIITIGPKCHVMACDRKTGSLLWTKDLVNEYGAEIPQWYTGQCPMIDKDLVILAPCGADALLIGLDAKTGETRWSTPNPDKLRMSHASIIPMQLNGKKSYVYSAIGGTVGISADASDRGAILWTNTEWAPSVAAPSPTVCGPNKLFLTAGYGAGGALLSITGDKPPYTAKLTERHKAKEGFAMEQQSAIFYQGMLFGVMPKDAGLRKMQFMAVPADHLTKFEIAAPRELRFGLGPFIMVDHKFYVLNDNGSMSILRIEGKTCKVLDTASLIKGQDAWGPIAYADGFMIMRDSVTMFCIDMKK